MRFGQNRVWKVQRRGSGAFVVTDETPRDGADVGRIFLYEVPWDTTLEPLGNNGAHSVSLDEPIRFSSNPPVTRTVEPITVDVQNVVIEGVSVNAGNQDYFKWDAASEDAALRAPRLKFTIRDDGDPHRYKWTVWFRETKYLHKDGGTNWTQGASKMTGTVSKPGEVSVLLTNTSVPGHLDGETNPRGPYTYDIRVVEYAGSIPSGDSEDSSLDRTQLKQPYNLWIPYQFQQNGKARDGHDMWLEMPEDDSGDYLMRASYYLFPNPELHGLGAKKIELVPMGPDLKEHPKYLAPTSTGVLHGGDAGLLAYRIKPSDPDGDWRLIFTGEDASGPGHPKRRDHTAARMIPVNQIGGARSMIPFDTHGGAPNITVGKGWYALWINATRVRKQVVNTNPAISVSDRVDDLTVQASRQRPPTQFEWAAINGGYYGIRDKNVSQPKPIIASAGTGSRGRWLHGSPPKTAGGQPLQRWSFGFNSGFSGRTGYGIGLMQPTGTSRPLPRGYRTNDLAVPRALETRFDFGLSGLLCLVNGGQPMVRQSRPTDPASAVKNGIYITPPNGGWDRSGLGFYDSYTYHAALAWTQDARHLFLVVHRLPGSAMDTRNLFANYRQVRSSGSYRDEWAGPGPVVQRINAILSNPTDRSTPRFRNFPVRIDGAMMLDGGHSATLKYQRILRYRGNTPLYETEGIWRNSTSRNPGRGVPSSSNGKPTVEFQPTLPTMVQVVR